MIRYQGSFFNGPGTQCLLGKALRHNASIAPAELLAEVRERLAALLQID